jgi:H(+)-transporting ATP synthase subunit D
VRGLPPGRAGRLWLRHRLDVAGRGISVLEQKIHALVREQRRLRHHVEDAERRWKEASRDADRWFLRSQIIGGNQELELARSQLDRRADAKISWRTVMGVTYPGQVRLDAPDAGVIGGVARSSALVFAAAAFREATAAALDHAAATRALHLVDDELAVTRRRLRGLEHRWVPQLRRTLRHIDLALAEEEREEIVRARWVAERQGRAS